MLEFLCNYAVSQGLPYEFVDWALDNYGHIPGDYPFTETLHREWTAFLNARSSFLLPCLRGPLRIQLPLPR